LQAKISKCESSTHLVLGFGVTLLSFGTEICEVSITWLSGYVNNDGNQEQQNGAFINRHKREAISPELHLSQFNLSACIGCQVRFSHQGHESHEIIVVVDVHNTSEILFSLCANTDPERAAPPPVRIRACTCLRSSRKNGVAFVCGESRMQSCSQRVVYVQASRISRLA